MDTLLFSLMKRGKEKKGNKQVKALSVALVFVSSSFFCHNVVVVSTRKSSVRPLSFPRECLSKFLRICFFRRSTFNDDLSQSFGLSKKKEKKFENDFKFCRDFLTAKMSLKRIFPERGSYK